MSATLRLRSPGGRIVLETPRRALWLAAALAALIALVAAASLLTGSFGLTWAEVAAILARPEDGAMPSTVVWEFRFPRLLAALLTGAMLGLSGAILQGLTRNPLADPSLVGVSQGAALAVVALIVAFPAVGAGVRPLAAFGGAMAVAAVILALSRGAERGSTMRFILMGIGVAAFISAITATMLTYGRIEAAQAALGWLAGSIHAAGWGDVRVLALVAALSAPAVLWAARPLAALRFGAEIAIGHGVAVARARVTLVALSVALAATAVATVGPMGFVGLVAPHIARRLTPSGEGMQLLLTALTGALMVASADLIGRAAFAPVQIPAGIVTALVGAPVFAWMVLRSQARRTL